MAWFDEYYPLENSYIFLGFPDADWSFQCTFEAPRDHVFPLVTDENVYAKYMKVRQVKG